MKANWKWLAVSLSTSVVAIACGACGGSPKADPQTASSPSSSGTTTGGTTAGAPAEKTASDLGDLEYGRLKDSIVKDFAPHMAKFKTACGYDVKYDVDWPTLGRSGDVLRSFWGNMGTEKIIEATTHACSDAAGKAAVKKKITAIRVVNVADPAKASAVISGGTLTVQLSWTGVSSGMNDSELAAAILKQL